LSSRVLASALDKPLAAAPDGTVAAGKGASHQGTALEFFVILEAPLFHPDAIIKLTMRRFPTCKPEHR
jgi:hypothetical protein